MRYMRYDGKGPNSLVHAGLMLFPVQVEPCCAIAQSPPIPSPMARRARVCLRTSRLFQTAKFPKANQSLISCVMLYMIEGARERENSVHVAWYPTRQCRLEGESSADIINEIYLGCLETASESTLRGSPLSSCERANDRIPADTLGRLVLLVTRDWTERGRIPSDATLAV